MLLFGEMKVSYKLLACVLVVTLAGTIKDVLPVTGNTQVAQVQKATVNATIPLALPITADVVLKNGSSMTGKLTAFDSNKTTIQISRNQDSSSVQIAQIEKITFRPEALAYTSDGQRVIRGDDDAKAVPRFWKNISLNAFQLKKPNQGQASVDLTNVMSPKQLRGIRAVAKKSLYVTDEIQFEPASKMTIKVTPIDL